jgi:hypothetical protein
MASWLPVMKRRSSKSSPGGIFVFAFAAPLCQECDRIRKIFQVRKN